MRSVRSIVCVLGLAMLVGGCASHYRVTDATTGRMYYTKKIDKEDGGAVTLKDARTDDKITLQNPRVTKISKDEFEAGRQQSGTAFVYP